MSVPDVAHSRGKRTSSSMQLSSIRTHDGWVTYSRPGSLGAWVAQARAEVQREPRSFWAQGAAAGNTGARRLLQEVVGRVGKGEAGRGNWGQENKPIWGSHWKVQRGYAVYQAFTLADSTAESERIINHDTWKKFTQPFFGGRTYKRKGGWISPERMRPH